MKLMPKVLGVLVIITTLIGIKINSNKPDDIDIILNSGVSTEVKIERLQGKILTFRFNEPTEENWGTEDKKYLEKLNKAINELKSN